MSSNFRPVGDSAATFRFGEFTFDCGSRLLTHSGVKRHLSPKAQQLLQLLLVARPRALSREELYDALWPSTFVCETTLASIVNEVRRALGDDARASSYIRTVHGFGYAFCGEIVSAVAVNFMVATLQCLGQSHPLYEGENSVGRSQDCRVVIMAPTISRCHALITIHDDSFSIRDLDSKNGTFVEGQR
ncbi:MAG TPA: winged helix-turn-helix domain-containing protein, partial [Thermoanaerobaculia bacterium]|nr:winged helix-turn-helix domain-containing protein [Thermoanaerobaculia bacterium]